MKRTFVIAAITSPGIFVAAAGIGTGTHDLIEGGRWAAIVGGLSALWAIAPLGTNIPGQLTRLGAAFFTRLLGAMVIALLAGPTHAGMVVTLVVCLIAAAAVEVVLIRTQEPEHA